MSHNPTFLWTFFALAVSTATCEVFYGNVGTEVKFPCATETRGKDFTWKYNDYVIYQVRGKNEYLSRGSAPMLSRSRLIGSYLSLKQLVMADAGEYSCEVQGSTPVTHQLHVVSVSAKPTGVLFQNSSVELQCQVDGKTKVKRMWLRPSGKSHQTVDGSLVLPSVALEDRGIWKCEIDDNRKKHRADLYLDVIDLEPAANLKVKMGGAAVLPCVLNSGKSSMHRVTNVSWDHASCTRPEKKCTPLRFLTGGKEGGTGDKELKWDAKSSPQEFSNVKFPKENLLDFSVTLNNVNKKHAGKYICTLTFADKRELKVQLNLEVEGEIVAEGVGPRLTDETSQLPKGGVLLGLHKWIWVAIGVGCVVLIGLVITAAILYQRHKRMKRRAKRMRSMKRPLTAKNCCQCKRVVGQPNGKQRDRSAHVMGQTDGKQMDRSSYVKRQHQ